MSFSCCRGRLGVAAFDVGMSLAAPQADGVAAADSSDVDSAPAGQADTTVRSGRAAAPRRSAVARNGVRAPTITETRARTVNGAARTVGGAAAAVRTGRSRPTAAAAIATAASATSSGAFAVPSPIVSRSPVSHTVAVNTSPAPSAAPADSTPGIPVEATAPGNYRPAQVTWRSIIADTLSWSGLGSSVPVPSLPIPDSPVPDLIAGLWTAVRRLHYTFFNSAPTLNPTAYSEDLTTGVITGNLGGADIDGDVLTYTITSAPAHGTLAIADDGTYTYTPDLATSHSGGTDSFGVGVSDTSAANPWHIHPASDLIAGLAQILTGLGLATPADPATATVAVTEAPITSSSKPGLISSDLLTVNVETGEWNGDEPVMVTAVLEVTLGKSGSARVNVVNKSPRELGSGVDAGDTITIRDDEGDAWLNNLKPLSADDINAAIASKSAIPVPVVVTATLMLEGDFTQRDLLGMIGSTMALKLFDVGKVLESISLKEENAATAFTDAQSQIKEIVKLSSRDIVGAISLRVVHAITSGGDPDDPIGLNLTALVPCDSSIKDLLDTASALYPEQIKRLGLDAQWLRNDVSYEKVRTEVWQTDVDIRSGFLLPPEVLPNGLPASWTTSYRGKFSYNNNSPYDPWPWANYTVQTTAWPRITW